MNIVMFSDVCVSDLSAGFVFDPNTPPIQESVRPPSELRPVVCCPDSLDSCPQSYIDYYMCLTNTFTTNPDNEFGAEKNFRHLGECCCYSPELYFEKVCAHSSPVCASACASRTRCHENRLAGVM